MKNQLFDEHVKQQFEGYRPDVAPHIWENIIAEKKRRKPVPFWMSLLSGGRMMAALLVLVLGGTVFYFMNAEHESISQTAKTPAEKYMDAPEKSTGKGDNAPAETSPPIADINVNHQAVTSPETEVKTPLVDNNTILPAQRNAGNPAAKAITPKKQTGNNYPRNAGNAINSNTPENEERDQKIVVDNQHQYLKRNSGNLTLLETNTRREALLKMPKLPFSKDIPCPEVEKDAAGNKTYFEIYGGPDYVFRSFSDTENSAYLQERKATGSIMFAFSAGARYTRVFGNGISIRTGINYSQYNERFKFAKGNITHNIYITNAAGDTTGTYTETGTQYQSGTNIYRTLDVPVSLGYELGNGRLHANVNAGAMINIRSKQSGFVIDPSGTPIDISSGKQSTAYGYRTNVGVSLLGAVSFYYKLNGRFHLLGEPYLRYSLSPMTKEEISLKQRNHTAGLRLGLRMDLK